MSDDNEDNSGTETKVIKKRPGRPRKNPIRTPKPRNGIVSEPSDKRHFIEFLYDKPLVFKKLWQFFKLMAVNNIRFLFTKENIIMWCSDHHGKSHIRVQINCNEVNHYYNKDELDIGLLCKNPELIMATIDKTYNSILFLSKEDSTQKNIRIVLKNDIDIEESHTIELIGDYDRVDDDEKFLDENYAIKFKLPGKYFKKMVSDIRSFSDQVAIKQDGPDEPLIFEYDKSDKKIKSSHTIKNSKLISLQSALGEDDTFRTSFKIEYVKPISSAVLSENIEIYADENKPMMFIIQMDDRAIEMRILTNIIDDRERDIDI
jgi:hypothetical protein